MPEDHLIKHRRTEICNKAMDMRLIQINVETSERCGEM